MKPTDRLVSGLLASASAAGPPAFAVGTVVGVDASAAADGNHLVTVRWFGSEFYASYGAHYTPVIGHVVLMARTQPLAIICQLVGTPPT